ncbi:MAG TPA: dipeptidase [Longimicrobiales bacterium]|nr:dipeptidase [Longimicrobiales bacterium]
MTSRIMLIAAALLATPGPLAAQQPPPELLERARRILREAPVIDGHNDLPSRILGELGGDPRAIDLRRPHADFHTDLTRLHDGGVGAQFWSAYVAMDSIPTGADLRQALRQIDMVHRLVEAYPEQLVLARTVPDVEQAWRDGRIASLIGLEGGHAIQNTLAAVRMFHALGVRYITLTHNATSGWADAAMDYPRHRGLTEFGEQVIREMNRVGILVDLAHVSPETMRDAIRVSNAPVIFSHSSARALVDQPRNVPDDVLHSLRRNGGVVMVTFVPEFVAPGAMEWQARLDSAVEALRAELDDEAEIARRQREWIDANPPPVATVQHVADHIDHVREVAGIDHIGIGSDFDGIEAVPQGLEDVSTFPNLVAELLRRGYSEADVKQITSGNLLRVMRAAFR